jgi:ElaB/YqjD/DUF883 family membrane-anchored ribosome-binding protein
MVANNNSSSGSGGSKGSGSDTVSAANISAGTSTGNAGQPTARGSAQSATLASHTSSPMGGTSGTGAGPEHLRHQDKDAGKGMGSKGAGASGSGGGSRSGGSGGSQGGGISDVGNRAGEMASDAYDQASGVARDAYQQASSMASDAYDRGSRYYDEASQRSLEGFGQARRGVERFVSENPMMVGVIGLAAGLVIGALLPRTRQEDRTLGRWADEVRDQGMRYARDMAHRGREMIDETFSGDEEGDDWRQSGGQGRQGGQRSQGGRYQNH